MTRKRPEETRDRILEAAAQIILAQGAAHLTLDQVAQSAQVSKGGLLHHFPTKEDLMLGLMTQRVIRFRERVLQQQAADPEPVQGSWLRAYIRATFVQEPAEALLAVTFMQLVANAPELFTAKRAELMALFLPIPADGIAPARALAVQLACDGFWFSERTGLAQLDETQRNALQADLLTLLNT